MPRPRKNPPSGVLPSVWRVSDELWKRIKPILDEYDPAWPVGRKRTDPRLILDAILFRMRTGCQWNHLPKEYGDDSTAHRTFQRWEQAGILDKLWAALVEECDTLGGVNWEWQSALLTGERAVSLDTVMGKARLGGTRSGPIPRTVPKLERNEAC